MSGSSKPIIAYWDIRGLAQQIRTLLSYVGVAFEDKLYSCGPAPTFDRSTWLNEKHQLGLAFPNLPYYIDGDVRLTQSLAIMRFIASKYKESLLGQTLEEKARCEQVVQQVADLRGNLGELCYSDNDTHLNNRLTSYLSSFADRLAELDKFFGKHKFVAGNKETLADFVLYDLLDAHLVLAPDCLPVAKYPALTAFMAAFESLPGMCKILNAPKGGRALPLNNRMAALGNQPSPFRAIH